jgi:hypothetical protein
MKPPPSPQTVQEQPLKLGALAIGPEGGYVYQGSILTMKSN